LGAAFTALTGPIGVAIAAVAALIAIGVALYKNWDKIKAKAAEIWGVIRDTLVGILDAIKGFVEERWNAVATTTTTVWTTISDWLSALWERIKAQVTASWNAIYGTITGIWTRIKDGFDNLVKAAWNWGKNLLAEFIAGIKSKISALWDTLTNIAETVAGFLGFHSPTKLGPGRYADQWAPNFMRMFADGITKNLPLLEKALSRAVVVMQMSLAGGSSTTDNYNTGGNTINITVQDGEDLLRTLHRLGVRIP
jgi:phage-related protein